MKLLSRSIKILFAFAILLLILHIGQSTDYKNESLDLHSLDEEVIDAEPEEEQSNPQYVRETIQNVEADLAENTDEENEMEKHYGHYRITRFCPTRYYRNLKYDRLPDQEADMMLGRTVIIEPDLLVTYDSERRLGTREGRDWFNGNYMIEEYAMDNPQYTYIPIASDKSFDSELLIDPDAMSGAVGEELFDQIEGVITIPDLCSPFGTQYFYTLEDENKIIMDSGLSLQYFLLEKISEDEEKVLHEQLSDMQKNMLLNEVYGDYEIKEFLPTKFYPALDSNGYEILPEQEADMMLGQKITIREEMFCTYDNNRLPNSWFADRLEDGFWIKKVEIENPEYQVENRLREEIYGLRDDMLPDELVQKEYTEIDVLPGYYTGSGRHADRVLPQLFLVEDGQIIMYSMGEYFLLEKIESIQEDNQNERQRESESERIIKLYNDFLSGEINFKGYNIEEIATPTGEPEKRYHTDYAIVDSNGDGLPELHIRNAREFRVFSYKEGEIVHIYASFSRPAQNTLRNDGTFLYRDTTGAGTREDYYRVFQVDKDGNEHIESEFYWRDLNWNAIYDEDDQYFFNKEECTETEWINKTKEYIYINDERNAQGWADVLDEAEWTIYCEQKG